MFESSTQNVLLFLPISANWQMLAKLLQNIKIPKTLIKQGFSSLQKFSKNRQTNWQALADKHCHTSEFCIVNIKSNAMKIITLKKKCGTAQQPYQCHCDYLKTGRYKLR
jgi:hypothetical protein